MKLDIVNISGNQITLVGDYTSVLTPTYSFQIISPSEVSKGIFSVLTSVFQLGSTVVTTNEPLTLVNATDFVVFGDYIIDYSNGTDSFVIRPYQMNYETSLALPGRGALEYGEAFIESLVRLLEHFAHTTPPSNPITGQIWYDTGTSQLKVYREGVGWSDILDSYIGPITQPFADSRYVMKLGDTMQGTLVLNGNPTQPLHAATKSYVDAAVGSISAITDHSSLTNLLNDDHTQYALANGTRGNFASISHNHNSSYLQLTGGALTAGNLTLFQGPTLSMHATTKQYVDTAISSNSNFIGYVLPGTIGNVLTSNGTSWTSSAPTKSDWNAVTGNSVILNKPTFAPVATSGSYNDLSGRLLIGTSSLDAAAGDHTHTQYSLTSHTHNFGNGMSTMSVYSTAGSFIWSKPATCTRVVVTVIGGGGGGTGQYTGGGAGGAAIKHINASALASLITVTVGAGGAGTPYTGGSGGSSSFGTHCSATGGVGAVPPGSIPTGGIGVNGDLNLSSGQASTYAVSYYNMFGQDPPLYGRGGNLLAGNGLIGGGGAGNEFNSGTPPGGNGGDGLVIVEAYY